MTSDPSYCNDAFELVCETGISPVIDGQDARTTLLVDAGTTHSINHGQDARTTLLDCRGWWAVPTLLVLLANVAVRGQTWVRVTGGDIQSAGVLSDFGEHFALRSFAGFDANDTNGFSDVYVYDRFSQTYAWVSSDSSGSPGNNHSGGSNGPGGPGVAISADGRFVTFISFATNLVANDNTAGFPDVFLFDRDVSGDGALDTPGDVATTRVSVDTSGANEADGMCTRPDISGDGSFVVYASDATNLIAGDSNAARDIFLRDVVNGTTTRVSEATGGAEANGFSDTPSISRDGRFVVFESNATNFVAVDANGATQDVFIHDTQTGTTALVTQSSGGVQADLGGSVQYAGAVSGDGRYVVFESVSTNLVTPDNNGSDIYVRDTVGGATVRVSVNSSGVQANDLCFDASISDDGRYVLFKSRATNLGVAGAPQLRTYLHDRDADANGILDEAGGISTTLGILMVLGPGDPKDAIVSPTGDSIALFTPVPLEAGDGGFTLDLYFGDLELDQDLDGLLDRWEAFGIDANGDGAIDLALPSADHRRKNLYVEVDAMSGRAPNVVPGSQPTGTSLDGVVAAFANAPVGNPDGSTGIDLALLMDETNLPLQSWGVFPWLSFDALKNGVGPTLGFFGTLGERGTPGSPSPNWVNIRAARMLSYRYCIFADQYCVTAGNGVQSCSVSGRAELPGNDFFVTLGGCDWSGCWTPTGGTNQQQAGVFLHELGHALNLQHGGGNGINYKPNYYSVMNYTWTLPNFVNTAGPGSYAAFWPLDYSRGVWPALNEAAGLFENLGINAPINIRVPVGPRNPAPALRWTQGLIDFDFNGLLTPNASADVNFVVPGNQSPGEVLSGYDDWSNVQLGLSGHANFADGPAGGTDSGDELAFHELAQLGAAGDCNGNGVWDADDVNLGGFADCNGDGVPDECGFSDSFEVYTSDPMLHGQNGWKGWDDDPAFSGVVTEALARSAPRSVEIEGDADLVHEFCGATSGVWSFTAWQYVPSDFASDGDGQFAGSYFILLNTYQDGGPYHWSVQMGVDSNSGNLEVLHGNDLNTINVPYVTDRWTKIQVIVDADDDWTRIYYDDELVTEYPWTGGVLGDGGGALDIAAVDLFANGSSSVYYDDLRLASGCGFTRFADPDGDGVDTETELLQGSNSCEADTDDDGLLDGADNCPRYHNPDQADCNGNGVGDLCELLAGAGGDCNGNGVLDGCDPEASDVGLFVTQLLSATPDPMLACMYDLNGDGAFDGLDVRPFVDGLIQ